jgi:hypothetical protein
MERDLLDVAGGVSSFCADANARSIKVTSCDPIILDSLADPQMVGRL